MIVFKSLELYRPARECVFMLALSRVRSVVVAQSGGGGRTRHFPVYVRFVALSGGRARHHLNLNTTLAWCPCCLFGSLGS